MSNTEFLNGIIELNNKNILIWGGTSGIGLATALQAKKLGGNVTVVGSSAERSRAIGDKYGLNWLAADITDENAVISAMASVGKIDHLVLLSGTFSTGRILETDVSHFRKIFNERLWGAISVLNALGNKLAQDASVTLVSGALADIPTPHGTAIIAAVCATMETFGRNLALELAPRRVNTIAPGPINTPLLDKSLGEGRDAYVESLKSQVPVGRIGNAEEVGSAIVFLMTNGYMNGATLNIDGGMRLN
ncbi:TPA: SDR family oxidoreductase [Enterobacter hormaechei subsp. steigerwaltii]|nr:SDR family oxidoreductase [Enterobacter hormaechei subsp. steigerwaltii]